MQGVENRTELAGTILSRTRHPTLADYDIVSVKVEKASPVKGKADLLSAMVGTELPVTVRRELLDDSARPGASIRLGAKRTPDGAMADKFPDPGAFAVGEAPQSTGSPVGPAESSPKPDRGGPEAPPVRPTDRPSRRRPDPV